MSLEPGTKLPIMQLYLALSNLLNYLTTASIQKNNTPQAAAMDTVTMETSTDVLPNENITRDTRATCISEERPVLEADIILSWFWQGFSSLCLSVLQEESEEKVWKMSEIFFWVACGIFPQVTHFCNV